MKRLRIHHVIAWLLLIIMGLIVIHAPLTVFIGSRFPGVADTVKAWKELLMLAALILLIIDYTCHRVWRTVVKDVLLWLIAGYAALHIMLLGVHHLPVNATIAGLMIDLRYVAYFALVYLFLIHYPAYKSSFLKISLYGAALVVGFAVLQLVLPHNFLAYFGYGDKTIQPYITVDKNPAFVRENSTLRGPNPLGAYAIIVLAGVLSYVMSMKGRRFSKQARNSAVFFGISGLVALFVSYSRSAWIGAAIALAVVFIAQYKRAITLRKIGYIAIATVIIAALVYGARHTYFIQNVLIHNNPTTGAVVDSNTGHLDSLQAGIAAMMTHPFGNGVGSTGSASLFTSSPVIVENQFLFTAHETGWIGLVLFIAISALVLLRLWRKRSDDWTVLAVFASGIGLIVVGLMLPVWVDDTVSIVWWGLAAVCLAPGKEIVRGTTSNKKAKRAT